MIIAGYILSFCAVVYHAVSLFTLSVYRKYISAVIQAAAALFILIILFQRSIIIKFAALTSTYESLLFYGMVILIVNVWYVLQDRYKHSAALRFWASAAALTLLLIATSPLFGKEALPPIPALRSAWLLLHVAFSFIGESFFVFAFISSLSLIFLGKNSLSHGAGKLSEKEKMFDNFAYAATVIGYGFFTIGALIFGAVWAETAWGSFWSWDPKETWALITWLIYSLYLHLRVYRKTSPVFCAWVSVIGFAATIFTFFGVNYLLPGLHSYG